MLFAGIRAAVAVVLFAFLTISSVSATVFLDSHGKDPRQEMLITSMPWSSIGLVTADLGGGYENLCTGTLIGRRLVLTAAHCVIKDYDDVKKNTVIRKVRFQPGYGNGVTSISSSSIDVIVGTMDVYANGSEDWAILALKDDLGTENGTMDVESTSELSLPMTVQTAGYSHDFPKGKLAGKIAGMVSSCQIYDTATEGPDENHMSTVFKSDCTATDGASGSPFFHFENGRYVIAAVFVSDPVDDDDREITTSTYSWDTANTAVMSEALIQAVRAARQKYE